MAGKHAAPGRSDFLAGFLRFVLVWSLAGVALFSLVWVALVWLPDYLEGRDEPTENSLVVSTFPPVTTTEPAPATTTTVPVTTTVGASATTTAPTTPSSTTTTTTLAAVRAPSEIVVRVRNSTGRSGIAAALTSDLAALGYQTVEADNYPTPQAISFLYYAPGFQAEAFVLAEQLPPVTVAENPATDPSADLLVILGADYP